MENTIKHLQEEIEAKYPVNTLHILNGSCMLEQFKTNKLMSNKATYVSFNEAMCWGETHPEIFSHAFVEKRSESLNTTTEEYRSHVIGNVTPLFAESFDLIVLWFGDDMFCQMNMITLLAYLEQVRFEGDVLFCMVLESKDRMLTEAIEIDISGYSDLYKTVLCHRQKSALQTMPVTSKAINKYLTYKTEDSPIVKHIKRNKGKENLVADLLSLFPEYGLGDVQYQRMIDEYNNNE